jgi:nitrogen fixation protein FixH
MLALCLGGSALACQWLGPCPDKPYVLADSFSTKATPLVASWRWEDRRTVIEAANRPTSDGYVFADNVVSPRPFEYVQREFARQLAEHDAREEILEKLRDQKIVLLKLEMSVGLWVRFNEAMQGRWEFMRVKIRIDVDGREHEALAVHRFNNRDKPSPMSPPMQEAVSQLLNMIQAFQ